MKNMVLLFLLFVGISAYAQHSTTVTVEQRKKHVMETYGVSEKQAVAYEQLRKNLLEENNSLKRRKISSEQFKKQQKELYKSYGNMVCQLFSKEGGNLWIFLTQELERYQILNEERLVPHRQMAQLIQSERAWSKTVKQLQNSAEEADVKFDKKEKLLAEFQEEVRRILGRQTGDWYIDYKSKVIGTLDNMDKYAASYAEAYKITCIEQQFRQNKMLVLKSKKKYVEKEIELIRLEGQREKDIVSCLSKETAMRWKKINADGIGYGLKSKYGLSDAQIVSFKKAYGKYVLEEYKILRKTKLSKADKYAQLSLLGSNFLQTVKPLFPATTYGKWEGWWKYSFEKKMEKKNLK